MRSLRPQVADSEWTNFCENQLRRIISNLEKKAPRQYFGTNWHSFNLFLEPDDNTFPISQAFSLEKKLGRHQIFLQTLSFVMLVVLKILHEYDKATVFPQDIQYNPIYIDLHTFPTYFTIEPSVEYEDHKDSVEAFNYFIKKSNLIKLITANKQAGMMSKLTDPALAFYKEIQLKIKLLNEFINKNNAKNIPEDKLVETFRDDAVKLGMNEARVDEILIDIAQEADQAEKEQKIAKFLNVLSGLLKCHLFITTQIEERSVISLKLASLYKAADECSRKEFNDLVENIIVFEGDDKGLISYDALNDTLWNYFEHDENTTALDLISRDLQAVFNDAEMFAIILQRGKMDVANNFISFKMVFEQLLKSDDARQRMQACEDYVSSLKPQASCKVVQAPITAPTFHDSSVVPSQPAKQNNSSQMHSATQHLIDQINHGLQLSDELEKSKRIYQLSLENIKTMIEAINLMIMHVNGVKKQIAQYDVKQRKSLTVLTKNFNELCVKTENLTVEDREYSKENGQKVDANVKSVRLILEAMANVSEKMPVELESVKKRVIILKNEQENKKRKELRLQAELEKEQAEAERIKRKEEEEERLEAEEMQREAEAAQREAEAQRAQEAAELAAAAAKLMREEAQKHRLMALQKAVADQRKLQADKQVVVPVKPVITPNKKVELENGQPKHCNTHPRKAQSIITNREPQKLRDTRFQPKGRHKQMMFKPKNVNSMPLVEAGTSESRPSGYQLNSLEDNKVVSQPLVSNETIQCPIKASASTESISPPPVKRSQSEPQALTAQQASRPASSSSPWEYGLFCSSPGGIIDLLRQGATQEAKTPLLRR